MPPGDEDGLLSVSPGLGAKKYMERVHLMKAKRKARNQHSERRLVKAAEKELILVHKEHKWARFEEASPNDENWARFDANPAGQSKLAGTPTMDLSLAAAQTENDYRDDHVQARGEPTLDAKSGELDSDGAIKGKKKSSSNVLGRCNIHWIDMSAPPAPKKKAVKTSSEIDEVVKLKDPSGRRRCSHNRRVVFHRYDELIDDDGKKDYIYSLHERELEEELASYDVIDRVEAAASDVGYFFSLLRKDLQAEAFNRIGRLRKKERRVEEDEENESTSSATVSIVKGESTRAQSQTTA